jgi:hypothetical protein
MSAQLAHVVDLQEFRQRRHEHAAPTNGAPAARGKPMAIWMTTCWIWVVIPWPAA